MENDIHHYSNVDCPYNILLIENDHLTIYNYV